MLFYVEMLHYLGSNDYLICVLLTVPRVPAVESVSMFEDISFK